MSVGNHALSNSMTTSKNEELRLKHLTFFCHLLTQKCNKLYMFDCFFPFQ